MSLGLNWFPAIAALSRPGAVGLLATTFFSGSSAGLLAADLYPYDTKPRAEAHYYGSPHERVGGRGRLGGSVRGDAPFDRSIGVPTYGYKAEPYNEPLRPYNAMSSKDRGHFGNYDKGYGKFGKSYGEPYAKHGKSRNGHTTDAYGVHGSAYSGHDETDSSLASPYGEFHKIDGQSGELKGPGDHALGRHGKAYGLRGEQDKYSSKDEHSIKDNHIITDSHSNKGKYSKRERPHLHDRYRRSGKYDQHGQYNKYSKYNKHNKYEKRDEYEKHGGYFYDRYSGKHGLADNGYGDALDLADKGLDKHTDHDFGRYELGDYADEKKPHLPLDAHRKPDDYVGSKRVEKYGKQERFRGRSYDRRYRRYFLGSSCVPRRHVIRSLKSDGWYDFKGLRLRGRRAVVRASQNGWRYRLVIDRCYGHVIKAARIKPVSGYRRDAYRHPRIY